MQEQDEKRAAIKALQEEVTKEKEAVKQLEQGGRSPQPALKHDCPLALG